MTSLSREERRKRKHKRVRQNVFGVPSRPRLFVYKSLRHIYAQLIDDFSNRTITGVSSLTPEIRDRFGRGNTDAARAVGELLGDKALERGIEEVVFDRGGYPYHGRVQAVAEGAREAGLDF